MYRYAGLKKKLFPSNQNISSGFSPFSTCLEEITLWVILSFFLRKSIFKPKRELFSQIQEMLQTPEMLIFAVCGSFWGAKIFLVIFVPFHMFDKKKSCLYQIKIFPQDLTCFKLGKKNNFTIDSWLVRYQFFRLQREFFVKLQWKFYKTP